MEYHDQVPPTWYETVPPSPNQNPAFETIEASDDLTFEPTFPFDPQVLPVWGTNQSNQDNPWEAHHTLNPPPPQVAPSSSGAFSNATHIPEWAQQPEPSTQSQSDFVPDQEESELTFPMTTLDNLRERFLGLGMDSIIIGEGQYGTVYEVHFSV